MPIRLFLCTSLVNSYSYNNNSMELRLPLKDISVNQPFGVNYVDFYKKMGLKGHNGVDFKTRDGCPCYASHAGQVVWAGEDGDGGISVVLWNKKEAYKTIYYHLRETSVDSGDEVNAGELIGRCDNTGKYTTGGHLHFGLKKTYADSMGTYNRFNGYNGAIDPSPYFKMAYNGFKIGAKDYDKSRSYQRYYRTAKRNLANEMKTALYMARRLKRLPNNEEINMAIWGGWDMEAIMNPAMWENTSQLKKNEYYEGERPFT